MGTCHYGPIEILVTQRLQEHGTSTDIFSKQILIFTTHFDGVADLLEAQRRLEAGADLLERKLAVPILVAAERVRIALSDRSRYAVRGHGGNLVLGTALRDHSSSAVQGCGANLVELVEERVAGPARVDRGRSLGAELRARAGLIP